MDADGVDGFGNRSGFRSGWGENRRSSRPAGASQRALPGLWGVSKRAGRAPGHPGTALTGTEMGRKEESAGMGRMVPLGDTRLVPYRHERIRYPQAARNERPEVRSTFWWWGDNPYEMLKIKQRSLQRRQSAQTSQHLQGHGPEPCTTCWGSATRRRPGGCYGPGQPGGGVGHREFTWTSKNPGQGSSGRW